MRYETCNPGQDADSVETPPLKEETSSNGPLSEYPIGNTAINGAGHHGSGHHRNISESTAVNPDYAGTTKETVTPLSPTTQSPYQSTTQSTYDSATPYANQAANQRGGLGPVHERAETGQLNQF